MNLIQGETLDDLEYKGLKIIQRDGYYHFTSDSVLLANLAKIRKGARVLDIGAGSGIISILIAAKTQAGEVVGVEIQQEMADMAVRSVKLNNLEDRVKIINSDIRDARGEIEYESFDAVVTNPPYLKVSSGEMSGAPNIDISRRELNITLEEIIFYGARYLKFGGSFSMVHKAERLGEIIYIMTEHSLIPKRLILVLPKRGFDADTVIITGKKGAKHGMKAEVLTVYNPDNTMTREASRLYNKE
ncbi:MAG: tRNA1(Val) (adenine(37)-N6)-methyltransferase [Christensenellales bacterium]